MRSNRIALVTLCSVVAGCHERVPVTALPPAVPVAARNTPAPTPTPPAPAAPQHRLCSITRTVPSRPAPTMMLPQL